MKFLFALLLFPVLAFGKSFVPTSFSANYEESLMSVTGKEKKSYGKLDYKYPGHLRLEVKSPNASLFVVNPQRAWLYQPAFVKGEKDQVTVQRSADLPVIKFLDSVKDGLEKSKLFKTSYKGKQLTITFNKDHQKEMGITEVVLHTNKEAKDIKSISEVKKLELKKVGGTSTTIKFIDLKQNVDFSKDHFTFTPTKDMKVIQN